MTKVRLITFDVTGTILKPTTLAGPQYTDIAEKYFGVQYSKSLMQKHFKEWYKRLDKKYPLFGTTSGVSTRSWWFSLFHNCLAETHRKTLQREGWPLPFGDRELRKAFEEVYQTFKWSLCSNADLTLRRLKQIQTSDGEGIKLAAISNSDDRTPSILSDCLDAEYFDCVVTSVDAKCEKPDPRIFRFAFEKLGLHQLKPDEALHVGDEYQSDFIGARNAGMNALLLAEENDETVYPDLDQAHVIRNLLEVVDYVNQT